MKRSEKQIYKNLAMINDIIEDDKRILSDKYENLKLSHNRKSNLLKQVLLFLEYKNNKYSKQALIKRIEQELIFNGRVNYGAKA